MRNSVFSLRLVFLAGMCIPILEVAGWIGQSGGGSYSGCHSDSACHSHPCRTGETPYCHNGGCHCRDLGCHSDNDCLSHPCGTGQTPYCSSYGHCYCEAIIPTTTTATAAYDPICHSKSDCHNHHCQIDESVYCIFGSCLCEATIPTEATTTTSFSNTTITTPATSPPTTTLHTTKTTNLLTTPPDPICHSKSDCHNHHCQIDESVFCILGSCLCEATIPTEATTTTSFKNITITTLATSPSTTILHTTKTTNLLTTPEPTAVVPQSLTTCLSHPDCNGHVCQAGLHPYCKFGQHSSECQCTVCTDDSHCLCPVGQVGRCHFDLSLLKYSCTCEHPSESTVSPTATATIKPTTPQSLIQQMTTTPTTNTQRTTTTTTTKPVTTPQLTTHPITNPPATKQTTPATTALQPSSHHQTTTSSTDLPSTFDLTTLVQSPTAHTETNTTRQTTSASTTRRCHVCGDNDNGIPCDTRSIYTGNLQKCDPSEDFCMTDLIHDGQAYPNIYKRCVTEEECRNKWLHQTSDLEHCTNYGNVLVEGHYSCHFCCTSDGCNTKQIPDKSTLYIKV